MKPSHSTSQPPAAPTRADITRFMPLVHQEAARVLRRVPRCVQMGDMVAAGSFGLFDALRKSPERGPAFDGYARMRIRGAMMDELRTEDWLSRKARAATTRAHDEGTAGGTVLIGIDDLPVSAQDLCDEQASTPLDLVIRHLDGSRVHRALTKLPEREAKVVRWHYLDEVPFQDIATRLGVSPARISQLHGRALQLLRSAVTRDDNTAVAA